MDRCLSCGIWTEYRESVTNYFCQPRCQQKFYLLLGGLGESLTPSIRKRPGGLKEDSPIWKLIVEYDSLRRKDPDNPSLGKTRNFIIANLNNFIRKYEEWLRFFELIMWLKDQAWRESQARAKTVMWNYKLRTSKREFEKIKVPEFTIDATPEEMVEQFREYQLELENYHEYCRKIIEKRIFFDGRYEREYKEFERLGKLLNKETDLEQYNDGLISASCSGYKRFIEELENLRADLVAASIVVEESSDLISSSTEEDESTVVEEIEVERDVEVVEGMTQAQLDVFESIEDRIIEYEKISKKPCISYVAEYLRNCDIVMHVPLYTILRKMVEKKDIFLRNLFEVGTGGGSTDQKERAQWEHKIFQSEEYDKFPPHEKVKYATINWAHSRQGVSQVTAFSYGKSHLILRDSVKKRATYSRQDSSYPSVEGLHQLGTYKHMCYLSQQFDSVENRMMQFYIDDKKGNPGMNTIKDYVEVQIHGELVFARDVAKIMLSQHMNNAEVRELLAKFFKIIGKDIPYEFI